MWIHAKRRKSRPQWQPKRSHPSQKPHKTCSYACHMCGLNGHKMTDCLKFIEM